MKASYKIVVGMIIALTAPDLFSISSTDVALEQVKEGIENAIQTNDIGLYLQTLQDLDNIDGMSDLEKAALLQSLIATLGVPPQELTLTNGLDAAMSDAPGSISYSNVGGGREVFKEASDNTVTFRTLTAGNNMTLTQGTNGITIATTAEANRGANVGGGTGLFKSMNGTALQIKTLRVTGSGGISITGNTNDVTLGVDVSSTVHTASFSAAFSGTMDLTLYKIGKIVVMHFPSHSEVLASSVSHAPTSNAIPAAYRPERGVDGACPYITVVGGTPQNVGFVPLSTGLFRFYFQSTWGTVTAGTTVEIKEGFATWFTA